jgi:hypothetical protein
MRKKRRRKAGMGIKLLATVVEHADNVIAGDSGGALETSHHLPNLDRGRQAVKESIRYHNVIVVVGEVNVPNIADFPSDSDPNPKVSLPVLYCQI